MEFRALLVTPYRGNSGYYTWGKGGRLCNSCDKIVFKLSSLTKFGKMDATEEMLMMQPPPLSFIESRHNWVRWKGAFTFTDTMWSNLESSI